MSFVALTEMPMRWKFDYLRLIASLTFQSRRTFRKNYVRTEAHLWISLKTDSDIVRNMLKLKSCSQGSVIWINISWVELKPLRTRYQWKVKFFHPVLSVWKLLRVHSLGFEIPTPIGVAMRWGLVTTFELNVWIRKSHRAHFVTSLLNTLRIYLFCRWKHFFLSY